MFKNIFISIYAKENHKTNFLFSSKKPTRDLKFFFSCNIMIARRIIKPFIYEQWMIYDTHEVKFHFRLSEMIHGKVNNLKSESRKMTVDLFIKHLFLENIYGSKFSISS